MTARFWHHGAVVVLGYVLLSPAEASAKGLVFVTWGDTISHVGDVPLADRQDLGANRVGYKYRYFGVFWVNLWIWGGEYCVYEGKRYRAIPRAEAARLLGKTDAELGIPFLYRFPLGCLILVYSFAVLEVTTRPDTFILLSCETKPR